MTGSDVKVKMEDVKIKQEIKTEDEVSVKKETDPGK